MVQDEEAHAYSSPLYGKAGPPERIRGLQEVAYNPLDLNPTIRLLQRLDADLWEESRHNPVRLLGRFKTSCRCSCRG